jgi:hypothetical protein
MLNFTRAAKRIGDFGEGLVTYTLIRKGFEVACVDDIGADLIASGRHKRYAVSVKARLFRPGSRESRCTVITCDHLQKLQTFAERFDMHPMLAQVVALADDRIIHLFIFHADQIERVFAKCKDGFNINFGTRHLERVSSNPLIDYSCWREELIHSAWFGDTTEE